MAEKPIISIVIPTYNRTEVLEECLLSIDAQSYAPIQVIVSDDSRSDSVKRMIANLKTRRRIEYYQNPTRLGLPANRNSGIRHAKGDFVMSLDDDAILDKGCVERLITTYFDLKSTGVRVGAIGPAVITDMSRKEAKTIQDFAVRRFQSRRDTPCIRDGLTGLAFMNFSPDFREPLQVEELHSSSMYPIEVLKRIGGYEERLYQGNYICEETDLHARIRKKGYKLFFEPRAILQHKPTASGGCRIDSIRYGYFYVRNQCIFTIRHSGARAIIQVPALILFVLVYGLRSLICYGIARQRP